MCALCTHFKENTCRNSLFSLLTGSSSALLSFFMCQNALCREVCFILLLSGGVVCRNDAWRTSAGVCGLKLVLLWKTRDWAAEEHCAREGTEGKQERSLDVESFNMISTNPWSVNKILSDSEKALFPTGTQSSHSWCIHLFSRFSLLHWLTCG